MAEGVKVFEKVFKTSDKDALPWWLRYSMALLETDRGAESVAIFSAPCNGILMRRSVKAFATALYTSLGSPKEANRYWEQMKPAEQAQYGDISFLKDTLKWGHALQRQ